MLSPQIHKRIQQCIKSKLKASHIIKVRGETLSDHEAINVWTGYLAAQVSWQGPQSPAQVLDGLRNNTKTSANPNKEFDDEADAEAAKEVYAWAQTAERQPFQKAVESSFSFVEYCEAQATMNAAANTSPTDGMPMLLPLSTDEAIRACVLGLITSATCRGAYR